MLGLSILNRIAQTKYSDRDSLVPEIDGQDLCSTVLEELRQIKLWLNTVRTLRQESRTAWEEESCDNDPDYDPEQESQSNDEEGEMEEGIPKTASKDPKAQKKRKAEQASTGETSTASKKPKFDPAKGMEQEPMPSTNAWSHHKKMKCVFCGKEVFDLKRHLRMHANNEEIEDAELEKSFSIATKANKRRGPRRPGNRKGLPLKWCPVTDCSFVTAHLRKHLANKHKVKAGAYMDNLLKVARSYQGQGEVEDLPIFTTKEEQKTLTSPKHLEIVASPMPELEHEEVASSNVSDASEPEYEDDQNDEDYDGYVLQEEYFKEISPKTIRHKSLVLFY